MTRPSKCSVSGRATSKPGFRHCFDTCRKPESKKPRKLVSFQGFRYCESGGEEEIRTLDTVSRIHTFQACSFNHSDTSPDLDILACSLSRRANVVEGFHESKYFLKDSYAYRLAGVSGPGLASSSSKRRRPNSRKPAETKRPTPNSNSAPSGVCKRGSRLRATEAHKTMRIARLVRAFMVVVSKYEDTLGAMAGLQPIAIGHGRNR